MKKIIDLSDTIIKELKSQSVRMDFRSLKSYIEHILTEKCKKRLYRFETNSKDQIYICDSSLGGALTYFHTITELPISKIKSLEEIREVDWENHFLRTFNGEEVNFAKFMEKVDLMDFKSSFDCFKD